MEKSISATSDRLNKIKDQNIWLLIFQKTNWNRKFWTYKVVFAQLYFVLFQQCCKSCHLKLPSSELVQRSDSLPNPTMFISHCRTFVSFWSRISWSQLGPVQSSSMSLYSTISTSQKFIYNTHEQCKLLLV